MGKGRGGGRVDAHWQHFPNTSSLLLVNLSRKSCGLESSSGLTKVRQLPGEREVLDTSTLAFGLWDFCQKPDLRKCCFNSPYTI